MFLWLQMGENLYTHVKLFNTFIYSGLAIQIDSFWNHEVVTMLKYFGCTMYM